jgi:CDP-paratose 2-epimerase
MATASPMSVAAAREPIAVAATNLREKLGVCQWFHFEDHDSVRRSVRLLKELGVRHLRTGISWADFLRPGGKRWYDWQMKALRDFDVLLSVWHTPPSIAEGGVCNGPPRRLRDYADFIDQVITEYGSTFTHLELWNEPNNWRKWDFRTFDPQWRKFGEMIGDAAYWAKQRGCRTVLGGMIPVDAAWLELIGSYGALQYVDVIAIHAFPGMWFPHHPNWDWHSHWRGWDDKLKSIKSAAGGKPIWVTETGLATWDLATNRCAKHDLQVDTLTTAASAPTERVYWYSLIDLDHRRDAIEGYHVDENEYHLGLCDESERAKPAFTQLRRLLQG